MYQVFYNNFILHDLRTEDYYLVNPVLSEKLSKVSEFTFTIYNTHPYFNQLDKLVPFVIVKKDGNLIFKGRIIKDIQLMDNSKQVACESALAFLNDTIQRPFNFQGTPEELYCKIFNTHNTQVASFSLTSDQMILKNKVYFTKNSDKNLYEQVLNPKISEISTYYEATGDKLLYIGKMTGANLDNNDYINRSSSDFANSFSTIEDKLLDSIGGYILERYVDDQVFIDWIDDFKDEDGQFVSSQKIEACENLIDLMIDNDASETYSVVIPLGAEIEQDDGAKKRVTIESVNNGNDYLVNELALEKYGWIVAPVEETTWDDVTLPSNLKTKAESYLNSKAVMLKSTVEINAVDLNVVDKDIPEFKLGLYLAVESVFHNISKTYLLTEKITPLTRPENMTVTLGETQYSLTGIQIDDSKNTINKVENTLSDYVTNEEITVIVNKEIENNSLIQQLPNEITAQVSEVYKQITTIETNINNNLYTKEQIDSMQSNAQQNILEIKNTVENKTTATEQEINVIKEQINNGVSKVTTTTGSFDENGLHIEKTGEEMNSHMDWDGMVVKRDNDEVLSVRSNGVNAENITVRKYWIQDPVRIEKASAISNPNVFGLGFFAMKPPVVQENAILYNNEEILYKNEVIVYG